MRNPLFAGISRARHRAQKGTALVELTFVLPVLLLLVLGTAFVGRVFYHSIIVNNAARAGTGYGVNQRYSDSAGMTAAAVADASKNITAFKAANVPAAKFFCTCPDEDGAPQCGNANAGVCWNGATPRVCADGSDTRIYVEVNTSYQFNTFGTDKDGNAVQVCILGNCLPASFTLNGCSVMRAR